MAVDIDKVVVDLTTRINGCSHYRGYNTVSVNDLKAILAALEQLNTKRICGDCQQVMNRNSDDDVWEPEQGLRELQKEILEHQCELLAKDTDILLLEKRVAELEGVIDTLLQAFDDKHPDACHQDCFDSSDGHGYEMQELAKIKGRKALLKDGE